MIATKPNLLWLRGTPGSNGGTGGSVGAGAAFVVQDDVVYITYDAVVYTAPVTFVGPSTMHSGIITVENDTLRFHYAGGMWEHPATLVQEGDSVEGKGIVINDTFYITIEGVCWSMPVTPVEDFPGLPPGGDTELVTIDGEEYLRIVFPDGEVRYEQVYETPTPDAAGGGVTDGDKGDVVVSGDGLVWTVENVAGSAVAPGISADNITTGVLPPARLSLTKAQLDAAVADADLATLGPNTFTGPQSVPDEAYGAAWNGKLEVPTKNAVYDRIQAIPAGAVGADPTAKVNTAAVSGVATTFMRSDAAPALDMNIYPTWTGMHTFSAAVTFGIAPQVFVPKVNIVGALGTGVYAMPELLVGTDEFTGVWSQAGTCLAAMMEVGFLGNFIDCFVGTSRKFRVDATGAAFVADQAYGAPWSGNMSVPTKNALYNKFQSLPTGAVGGNPTASVGLATVDGTAATFMRSDAAPPISQAIAPTWTSLHMFSAGLTTVDETYGPSWSGSLRVPTKNAIYNKIQSIPAGAVSANPATSIGLSTINGVAATFMRSDAAPALNQAIVPTWTGVHTFNSNAIFNGNVGIQNTGPTAALDVGALGSRRFKAYGSNGPYGTALVGDAGGWSFGYNFEGSAGTQLGGFQVLGNIDAVTSFFIGTYASQLLTAVPASGNVGIGTTNPLEKVHVIGSGVNAGVRVEGYGINAEVDVRFSCKRAGGTLGAPTTVLDGDRLLRINSQGYDGTAFRSTSEIQYVVDGAPAGGVVPSRIDFITPPAATPSMTVKSTGNVGIGTTNPTSKLSVEGTGSFTGAVTVPDDVYSATWNGSLQVPTKNAVYDKIEAMLVAGGGVVGGNPTGLVGLTAVNGAAGTFLRSDGAPALSQAIVPTWSGLHTFSAGLATVDEAYGPSWDGSLRVPTKNAIYDKIQTVIAAGSGGDVTAAANFGTDNRIIRSDGTGKGVQTSTVSITDAGELIVAEQSKFVLKGYSGFGGQDAVMDNRMGGGLLISSPDGTTFVDGVSFYGEVDASVAFHAATITITKQNPAPTLGPGTLGLYGKADGRLYSKNGTDAEIILGGGVALGDSPTWTGTHTFNAPVGIGGSPIGAQLDVNGASTQTIQARRTDGSTSVLVAGGTNGGVGTITNHGFQVYSNGQVRVQVAAGGNVGIGTTSPSQLLSVQSGGPGLAQIEVVETSDGVGNYAGYAFRSGVTFKGGVFKQGVNHAINIFDSTLPRLTVAQGGNVGVGTMTPNSLLSVGGDGYAGRAVTVVGNQAGSPAVTIQQADASGFGLQIFTAQPSWGGSPLWIQDPSTTLLALKASGNLGLGTADPASKLHLAGVGLIDIGFSDAASAAENKNWALQTGVSIGAGVFRLRAVNDAVTSGINAVEFIRNGIASVTTGFVGGDVGIGTSSPTRMLDVMGGARIRNYIESDKPITINAYYEAGWKYRNNGYAVFLGHGAAIDTFSIGTTVPGVENTGIPAWSWGLNIGPTGNVGIGMTSPSAQFQVETPPSGYGAIFRYTQGTNNPGLFISTIEATGVTQLAASGSSNYEMALATGNTERVRITSGGNVGIGTTAPVRLLTLDHASDPTLGFYTSGTERVLLRVDTSANLKFEVGGWERMRLTGGGYLGLGVTPSTLLHIFGPAGSGLRQETDGAYTVMSFVSNAGATALVPVGQDLTFYSGLNVNSIAEKMRLTGTGRLGLNTSNPTTAFQIRQPVDNQEGGISLISASGAQAGYIWNDASANLHLDAASTGIANLILNGNGPGKVGIGLTSPELALDVFGTIQAGSGAATGGSLILTGRYSGAQSFLNTLSSQASSGGTVLGYATHAKLGTSGYVAATPIGIGKTALTLDMYGLHLLTAPAEAVPYGTDLTMTERFTVRPDGQVGIGNGNPPYKLTVFDDVPNGVAGFFQQNSSAGDAYALYSLVAGAATQNVAGRFDAYGGSRNYALFITQPQAAANNFAIWSNASAQSYLQGSLGLGTPPYAAKLQVDGDVRIGSNTANINTLTLNGADGSDRVILSETAGLRRWEMKLGDGGAESAGDWGSSFMLVARSNSGGAIDAPIHIARAAGAPINLSRPVVAPSIRVSNVIVNGSVPLTATDPVGEAGVIVVSTDCIYVSIGVNAWARAALLTW